MAASVGNEPSPQAAEAAAMARCRDHASWKLTDSSSCGVCAVNDTILSTGVNTAGERWGAEDGAARPRGCADQLCSD